MQRQKDNLALPSAEHQAIESSQAGVETWKYKAKNSLMYYPEGEQARLVGRMGWDSVFGCGLRVCVCVSAPLHPGPQRRPGLSRGTGACVLSVWE